MTNRKQKVEELMESFRTLRRSMTLHSAGTSKLPRITPSQWGVLMMIEAKGKCTVKDVAHSLGISSSAATQLIDGLVKSGYVMRKAHAEDRRSVTLTLSQKSKKRVEKMKADGIKRMLQFFKALSDAEFDQFIRLNKKIVERFSKK